MDPSRRFLTLILAIGTCVLLLSIAIGERMGDRVFSDDADLGSALPQAVEITPAPQETTQPYGPGWRRSQALAAAPDPGFPDPRVPPQPLPTLPKATPSPTPSPSPATPSPNANVPIWRRSQPLPTIAPSEMRLAPRSNVTPVPVPSPSKAPGPSPAPPASAGGM